VRATSTEHASFEAGTQNPITQVPRVVADRPKLVRALRGILALAVTKIHISRFAQIARQRRGEIRGKYAGNPHDAPFGQDSLEVSILPLSVVEDWSAIGLFKRDPLLV
jgi:hypothetical protein